MVNWQVTATTLICTQKGNEVTVMIYRDGSLKCTGEKTEGISRYKQQNCSASSCAQVKAYLDKLIAEEQHG